MAETAACQQQTAIVTGGSRGLGRGIAQALAARGVHIVALERDAAGLEALERELHENLQRWDKAAYRIDGDGLTPVA
jgi:NAD(P)-dependent dehydrogenase (short-subunit alcohol dehydrogenase family)